MRLERRTLWLVVAVLAAIAWRVGRPWLAPPLGARVDRLQPAECWFDVPANRRARCGYLVLDDHPEHAVSRRSRLAVAVFSPAQGVRHADPVLFLSGGPGGAFGFSGKAWWWAWVDAVALDHGREFIAFDQRGVGRSRPRVDCPALRVLELSLLQRELLPQEEDEAWLSGVEDCLAKLREGGVDFSVFGSARGAADVEDLRRTLEVESWNLYGISYGTRLALTTARDFPAGVRSLVLDSPYPPEAEALVETVAGLDTAFAALGKVCAGDARCAAVAPDLYASLARAIAALNERPHRVRLEHPDTLEVYEMVLDGDRLIDVMMVAMSGPIDVTGIASAVAGLDRGDARAVGGLVRDYWLAMQADDFSYAVNFAVECREELPFNDPARLRAELERHPTVERHQRREADILRRACAAWDLAPAPAREREAVRSDVPALILSGIFDPVTPAVWAAGLPRSLPNAELFRFVAGHSVTDADPCAVRLIAAFLDDPAKRPVADCQPSEGSPFVLP